MKILSRSAIASLLAGTFFCSVTATTPARADYYDHHHDHGDFHGGGWHGDIHHFNEYDFARWRGGNWIHDFHDGRNGWWWVIGPTWYFYPAPVYPYPDPFAPPGVVLAGPPGQYVYYCPNPGGYYPYVPQCFAPWQAIAQAPQMAPPPVAVVAPQPAPVAAMPAAPMPAPAPAPQGTSLRDMDDRQLDKFAEELGSIHSTSPNAIVHIDDLSKRIEAFRETLFNRSYNAMDILHDTEKLQKKVAKKKAALHKPEN